MTCGYIIIRQSCSVMLTLLSQFLIGKIFRLLGLTSVFLTLFVAYEYIVNRQSCTVMLTILSFSEKCKNKGLTVRPLFLHFSVKQKKKYSKYFLGYSLRPYISQKKYIYILKNNQSTQLQI